jgi:hypothetical protein
MSTISSEYFGRNSGRYSEAASGKYKGFGVVDFEKRQVGDNYEPYPMASGQMTGGSAASLPTGGSAASAEFVKPVGKIFKFMQPKVTMQPMMMQRRKPVYPILTQQPKPSKKTSTHKRKSSKRGSSRRTKKFASRR